MPCETGLQMKYFVLKPSSKDVGNVYASASRVAMRAYADHIESTDPKLASELREWVYEARRGRR